MLSPKNFTKAYKLFKPTYPSPLINRLVQDTPAKNCYLDVATGPGSLLFQLVPYFKRSIGNDVNPQMISQCQSSDIYLSKKYDITLRTSPWQKSLQAGDPRPDLITIGQSLHWIQPDNFLSWSASTLEKNGRLMAVGYNEEGINYLTQNSQFNKQGAGHFKKLMQSYRPFFKGREGDLPLHYPEERFRFGKHFRLVERGSQKIGYKIQFEEYVKAIKTFNAHHQYSMSKGDERPLEEFIRQCHKDGILPNKKVQRIVQFFWAICAN